MIVSKGHIENKSALAQVMAWLGMGDKPLPEPMMPQFIEAYYKNPSVRWVNSLIHGGCGSNFTRVYFKLIVWNDILGTSCGIGHRRVSMNPSQHWLGAIITWANVNPELCHHMAWLGHSELLWGFFVCFFRGNRVLTHCGLVTPHDTIWLSHHWFRNMKIYSLF